VVQLPELIGETWYEIREVYYDKDGTVEHLTVGAISPGGATLEELSHDLELMQEALTRTTLDEDGKEIS